MQEKTPPSKPAEPDKPRRGLLPEEDRYKDAWLPEVGTKIPGRTGWRAELAKWFLPYR